MNLARTRIRKEHYLEYVNIHRYSSASEFSDLWRYQPEQIRIGPLHSSPITPEQFKTATLDLVECFKETCLFDLRGRISHVHVGFVADCGGATSTLSGSERLTAALLSRFLLHSQSDVISHIEHHPELLPVLNDARSRVEQYFGAKVDCSLTILNDPADRNFEPVLCVFIQTSLPPIEARAIMDRMDEEWWFDQPDCVSDTLNIDIQYL